MKRILCGLLCVMIAAFAVTPVLGEQITIDKKDLSANTALSKDVQNILMLLQDSDNGEATTAMLVASINSRSGSATMVSLVPNIVAELPLAGENLLSHAYALGGENLAMKSINEIYGLNIKKFVVIDVSNFGIIVDAVKGMKMPLNAQEAQLLGLSEGENILDADKTLAYMRIQSEDPTISRPYKSIMQLLYQGTRDKNPFALMDLGNKLLSAVTTNLGLMDMVTLATSVMGGSDRQELLVPAADALTAGTFNGENAYKTDIDAAKKLLMDSLY